MRGNLSAGTGDVQPHPVTECYGARGTGHFMPRCGRYGSHMGVKTMPATSKAQQKAAGAALSAKRGDTKKSSLKGASRDMYESMSEKQLEDFAETKRKGLPEKKKN